MSISQAIYDYIEDKNVDYKVVTHRHTACSSETAQAAHVSGKCLAKAVLLKDERSYLLAVIPANHHLDAASVAEATGRNLLLAPENDIPHLFRDCERGAVPPLGAAFGVQTLVSPDIFNAPEVYFEGGDHEHLLQMGNADFRRLVGKVQTQSFSRAA